MVSHIPGPFERLAHRLYNRLEKKLDSWCKDEIKKPRRRTSKPKSNNVVKLRIVK